MKATELQCGDLILVDGKPVRVYGVMQRMNRIYDTMTNDISIRRCEEIPLTAEILEKNGLTKDENCGYCIWLDKHLVAINLETHNLAVESILIAAEVQIADNYIHIPALPVHYVHELQHALRLCGLNELADDFLI